MGLENAAFEVHALSGQMSQSAVVLEKIQPSYKSHFGAVLPDLPNHDSVSMELTETQGLNLIHSS